MDRDQSWYLAMSKLDAMVANIPSRIDQSLVNEFHEILTLFANATGQDVSVFQIPADKMKKQIVSARPPNRRGIGGFTRYSDQKYCDDNFFQRRLQEVILYFANFQPPHKR